MIENIRVQPIPTEDATKWRLGQHIRDSINASKSDSDPKVTAPQTVARDELLGVWDSTLHWALTYTFPDKGALFDQGNQQRVFSTITMDLSASAPTLRPSPKEAASTHRASATTTPGRPRASTRARSSPGLVWNS
ncbi:hypothetical protein [Streptomyces sp. NPDC052701]|uniref:hypothetical protein n=1 Tax=Streptomyces sp. NPDC052701 TaxID=3155533 RepID=UPI00341C514C